MGVGTAGMMLVSKFQVGLIALPSALVAAELARHPGLEIELNLLHIAPSVPRPLLYKYPLIHAHISKLPTSIYDIHDLTRT